jgi:hypothetical protein
MGKRREQGKVMGRNCYLGWAGIRRGGRGVEATVGAARPVRLEFVAFGFVSPTLVWGRLALRIVQPPAPRPRGCH